MLKVKTSNDNLFFNTKEEVVNYFKKGIAKEGQKYFDNNNYFIQIEDAQKIQSVEDWENWKENFDEELHYKLKDLKELIGEELELLELDKEVKRILNDSNDKNSVFDGDTKDYVYNSNSYSYYLDDENDVDIQFEILEDNDNMFDIVVEVTGVELI